MSNKLSLDTIFSNLDMIDQHHSLINKRPEDVISGKIALGAQGNHLVFVHNSTSIITRIINFFRGISTDTKVVGKVVTASQQSLVKDERLIVLFKKINGIVNNGKILEAKKAEEISHFDRFWAHFGC